MERIDGPVDLGGEVTMGPPRSRRRTAVTAAVVVVGLAVVASVVGRGGGETASSPTTSVAPTSTAPVTTIASSTTTTTTTLGPLAPLNLGRPLLPEPTGLTVIAAIAPSGGRPFRLIYLDLDTGTRRQVPLTDPPGGMQALKDGVLIYGNQGDLRFLRDDGTSTPLSLSQPVFPLDSTTNLAWAALDRAVATNDRERYGLFDLLNGGKLGELSLPLGTYAGGAVDQESILVSIPNNGSYRFDAATGTAVRVGRGSLVDFRNGRYVGLECDDAFQCQQRLADADHPDGVTVVDGAHATTDRISLSPTGPYVLRTDSTVSRSGTMVVNIDTGETIDLGPTNLESSSPFGGGQGVSALWSADGRTVITPVIGGLRVWQAGHEPVTIPIGRDMSIISLTGR